MWYATRGHSHAKSDTQPPRPSILGQLIIVAKVRWYHGFGKSRWRRSMIISVRWTVRTYTMKKVSSRLRIQVSCWFVIRLPSVAFIVEGSPVDRNPGWWHSSTRPASAADDLRGLIGLGKAVLTDTWRKTVADPWGETGRWSPPLPFLRSSEKMYKTENNVHQS